MVLLAANRAAVGLPRQQVQISRIIGKKFVHAPVPFGGNSRWQKDEVRICRQRQQGRKERDAPP